MSEIAFLRQVSLLADLSDELLGRLAADAGHIQLKAGNWLFRDGRLAGRSLGIVLSGGGARAFAHVGVLEELVAAGVTLDRVAGVSMGAFIGAMFAMEMDADEIDARCYDEWMRRRPLGDYTIPRHSLIRGERARAMLVRSFGDVAIEELRRSFMSGAAELRSAELVVSRWGPLLDADLTIKPRAEGVGVLEFHQLDVARESGRAAAREALEEGAHELA
jgi:predicted acylesterase/phospholipase RssA